MCIALPHAFTTRIPVDSCEGGRDFSLGWTMKKVVTWALVASLFAASTLPARAACVPVVSTGSVLSTGATVGLSIAAASAVSLMFCSIVVQKWTGKQMTSEQAIMAAGLPFSCLFWAQPTAQGVKYKAKAKRR